MNDPFMTETNQTVTSALSQTRVIPYAWKGMDKA